MDPRQIGSREALDAALAAETFLLFKHSLICPASTRAFEEYRAFLAAHPEVPTAWVDVIGQRPLSRAIEQRTGVRHESPQALLFVGGEVRWHASHSGITRRALSEALGAHSGEKR